MDTLIDCLSQEESDTSSRNIVQSEHSLNLSTQREWSGEEGGGEYLSITDKAHQDQLDWTTVQVFTDHFLSDCLSASTLNETF